MKTQCISVIVLLLLGTIASRAAVEVEPSGGRGTVAGEPAAEGDGVRTLYLVRHGFYEYEEGVDPDVGLALVPLGVAQARLVGARLRGLPIHLDALHASTMTRARQTARVIAEEFPHLEVQLTRILRECTPTTRRQDIMDDLEPGEAAECEAQLDEAFKTFFVPSPDADRHEVLVCHGNVIRYLVTRAQGVDTHSWLTMSVGNCSVTVIRITADGRLKILGVGDVGHLPPNMQTGTFDDAAPLAVPADEPGEPGE